jgi:hypothetical protein
LERVIPRCFSRKYWIEDNLRVHWDGEDHAARDAGVIPQREGGHEMDNLPLALLSGLGSGLIVALVNYFLTRKIMLEKEHKEFESYKFQRIKDLVSRFEDVRINYQRIRNGTPPDKEFEIRGSETIPLTMIKKDLCVFRSVISGHFHDLLQQQYVSACNLAMAIKAEDTVWGPYGTGIDILIDN